MFYCTAHLGNCAGQYPVWETVRLLPVILRLTISLKPSGPLWKRRVKHMKRCQLFWLGGWEHAGSRPEPSAEPTQNINIMIEKPLLSLHVVYNIFCNI